MKARDIMTKKVISMRVDTTVSEATEILVNNKISGAPVLENNEIKGIVSEKDLLVALDFMGTGRGELVAVSEFMTKDIISFSEDMSVKEIMQELVRKNIKRVPIIKDNKVVGIVSRRDILIAVKDKGCL